MKALCSTDRRLVDDVAKAWVDGGGDAEGIAWLWECIRDRVQEITDERTNKEAGE